MPSSSPTTKRANSNPWGAKSSNPNSMWSAFKQESNSIVDRAKGRKITLPRTNCVVRSFPPLSGNGPRGSRRGRRRAGERAKRESDRTAAGGTMRCNGLPRTAKPKRRIQMRPIRLWGPSPRGRRRRLPAKYPLRRHRPMRAPVHRRPHLRPTHPWRTKRTSTFPIPSPWTRPSTQSSSTFARGTCRTPRTFPSSTTMRSWRSSLGAIACCSRPCGGYCWRRNF
mmetsp:Transcript_4003/g.7440  ORF Transcript_4003/g.7440 Transcript_4003/m.7440 type:complete len:224 (+) Transcript_4003:257-928(+)